MLVGNILAEAHEKGALREGLSAILPHAPFEVSATLLAATVGFVPVSVVVWLALGRTVYTSDEVRDAVLLAGVALLLITLAAMVEAWVTPSIIGWTIGGPSR